MKILYLISDLFKSARRDNWTTHASLSSIFKHAVFNSIDQPKDVDILCTASA